MDYILCIILFIAGISLSAISGKYFYKALYNAAYIAYNKKTSMENDIHKIYITNDFYIVS